MKTHPKPSQTPPQRAAEPKPYDQRTDESAKAYAAFRTYCEMGSDRAMRAVAKKLSKSLTIIGRWGSHHEWAERTRAWDGDQLIRQRLAEDDAVKSEAEKWAKRRIEIVERDYELGQLLQKKAKQILARKGIRATIAQASRASVDGSKLQRLAAGLHTERQEITGADGGPIEEKVTIEETMSDERAIELMRQVVAEDEAKRNPNTGEG